MNMPSVNNNYFKTLQIDFTFNTYDKFFNLSLDVKQKYTKNTGTTRNGWDELERERCTCSVFCVLHLPLVNHNYIASSVIPPKIFNQQEVILMWINSNCLNQLILFFFV